MSKTSQAQRVIVQGHFLHHPYSGIGVFLEEVLREWSMDTTLDIHVLCWFVTNEQRESIERRLQGLSLTFHWTAYPPHIPRALSLRLWEMLWIPFFLRKQGIAHHYFSPDIQPRLLPFAPITKSVHMVLHDTFLFTEASYTKSFTRKLYNILLKKTLRDPGIFLWTVSEESKKSILKHLAPNREIHMLSNGVDHLQRITPKPWEKVTHALGIERDQPYILYNGGYDERKNVPVLLTVFQALQKLHPDLRLVLCGNSHFMNKLYTNTAVLGKMAGVIHTGFIKRDTLRSLLQHASVVASPSRAEGFNIPIGEALMEGTPVIASDIPIHREIWGAHAFLTNFSDTQATLQLFEQVLSKEREMPSLTQKEREKLSWHHQAGKIRTFFVY